MGSPQAGASFADRCTKDVAMKTSRALRHRTAHQAPLLLVALAALTAVSMPAALAQTSAVPAVAQSFKPRLKIRAAVPSVPAGSTTQMGAPLVGLDAASLAAFKAGRTEFTAIETPEGGLGPIFNERSCVACHSAGGVGGASAHSVTRFGRLTSGQFDALESLGGSLLQAQALTPNLVERVPPEANVVARRITTPLFGAGLIEAIADEDLQLQALKPQPDGIKGRVHLVADVATGQSRVGRFGWKAQHATLLSFTADAYLNEMGVTNRFFPTENAPNGRTALIARLIKPAGQVDDPVDPATGQSDVDHAADFMRFLAPPPALRQTSATIAGGKLFEQIKCTACHVPSYFTGASKFEPLNRKAVALYSDLLLHNMGKLGDGITQGQAGGSDMRTAPLWGLRARPVYLHDGRAISPKQAITLHDGEAVPSRNRFNALKPTEQQQLIDFLLTL
jgi:CxxC motif-containing protein (DUF1111 family)